MRVVVMLWAIVLGMFASTCAWAQQAVQPAEIVRKTDNMDVAVRYPAIGQAVIDADLAHWAASLVQDFEQNFAQPEMRVKEAPPFSLNVLYAVERPSERALSAVFEVSSYTGGVHGNLDILVRSYDMQSGRLLTLEHLFEDAESALQIMSTYCAAVLRATLGSAAVEDMLKAGTSPDADNFAAVVLRPEGIRVYFQPYQVAPWSAGPQAVEIPLEVLAEARPVVQWWGKKTEAEPQTQPTFQPVPHAVPQPAQQPLLQPVVPHAVPQPVQQPIQQPVPQPVTPQRP